MLEFILATATIVGQVQVNAYTYETNFLTQDNELITVVQEVEPDQIFEGCQMITSKKKMLDIMKQCDGADTLTREEKFQVFCRVCDNMLKDGRMTKATHKRFTHIW